MQMHEGRKYPTVIQKINCPTFRGQPNPEHERFYFAGSIPLACWDASREGSSHYDTEQEAIDAALAAGVTHLQGVDCRKIVWGER
jgi:hypothetical protein